MAGRVPLRLMQASARSYRQAGGSGEISDYYTAAADTAVLDPALLKHVVFAPHNLATDASFNEFNLICCRNVLIYFRKVLQDRAHELFHASLAPFGMLGLGSKESIEFTAYEHCYEAIVPGEKLYRRVR